MLADFIALSDNLYETEPERIAEQEVTTTVAGGVVEFGDIGWTGTFHRTPRSLH